MNAGMTWLFRHSRDSIYEVKNHYSFSVNLTMNCNCYRWELTDFLMHMHWQLFKRMVEIDVNDFVEVLF